MMVDKQSFHLLLSTITCSVLLMAAVQAMLLGFQEYQLNHKRLQGIIRILPPLDRMEILLFRLIRWGFWLLTLVLLTSLLFFQHSFAMPLLTKTIFSFFIWIVFAILLLGRTYRGWRAGTAVRWTVGGVALLIVLYYGAIQQWTFHFIF